ncbi:hypothetical protein SRB5_36740 [Streptomyces sp. RB5]|uniref:Uncharacterized protein n=1 Tax=Streptomyces smaragdinus TaxID=2585196 RepID=A0A7K0CJA0_9ACTN|nr:hypothetical protein [Streptomyces smaragdinus]MQY13526.1 hypothetical protein [Streptomyces smaragdinus]
MSEVPPGGGRLRGRDREVDAVLMRLHATRLVTLTGVPGVGTTGLGREVAEQARLRDGRDVVWVSGAGDTGGLAERLRRRFAGGREALLVLDGWDHPALVAELLDVSPRLRLLVVADRPLGLPGEDVLVLPPLAVPAPDAPTPDLRRLPAVALLADHPGADAVVEAHPALAAEACRRAQGIPAALVEASAWLAGPDTAPGDLDAMEHAFTHDGRWAESAARSYGRCSEAERLLWRRLSVFHGAFDNDAVLAVCVWGALAADEVRATLARIAPFTLLPVPDAAGSRRLLPAALRALGARELGRGGEYETLLLHHRRWFVGRAWQAAAWWRAGRQSQARELALAELADLRAAMDPRTAPGSATAEAGTALDVAVGLWFLWVVCGRAAEGRERLRTALDALPAPAPARALWLSAWLELDCGAPATAARLIAEATRSAARDDDAHCLGLLAHLRGAIALWSGDPAGAIPELRASLGLLDDTTPFGPGRELIRVSLALALARTDPAQAREVARPDVADDPFAEAWLLRARSELLQGAGDLTAAHDAAEGAVRTHLAYGTGFGAVCAAEQLAVLEAETGRLIRAARLLGAVDGLGLAGPPAPYREPARRRCEALLTAGLPQPRREQAYASGARVGLRGLVRTV